uniref:Uncharacterized protein n=1 Tax=Rhizophora mucronata TaxID=61149 RepID=A0A2P2NWF3_RHIMU
MNDDSFFPLSSAMSLFETMLVCCLLLWTSIHICIM